MKFIIFFIFLVDEVRRFR